MATLGNYRYEHIFIDNCSGDNTVAIIKRIAAVDKHVKLIVNARNFGHIRSPIHALLPGVRRLRHRLGRSDLQDPPEMMPEIVTTGKTANSSFWGPRPRAKRAR